MDDKTVFLRERFRGLKGKLARVKTLYKLLGYMRTSLFYGRLIARNLLLDNNSPFYVSLTMFIDYLLKLFG